MDKSQGNSSNSTPQMSMKNTPRRSILHQHIGTPLQRIKGETYQHIGTPFQRIRDETPDKEVNSNTPVSINPFEVKADSLYFPSCSPSVFATFARNKTDNGHFRWSIDHVSVLYPADIDETSIPNVWVDPEHETQAQKAIDAFFSQNSIVPSPWSSEESKVKREAKIRRTTRKGSFLADAADATTQTMITIPPTVDLMALLGNEFLYNEEHDTAYSSPTSDNSSSRESDIMSSSSLRRKLFTADEDCKTPSRLERKDLLLAKQWSTPTVNMRSFQSTPSDLLSSSPITPPNCSESCIIRTSPQMSPITGPSSHKSIRMHSFIERLDEESNSQLADKPSQMSHASDNSMSFNMDSQDPGNFQSYTSEKQDTGYVTGSMFSLQNMTSEIMTSGLQPHISPVAELLDDCGFSNTASNMSCTSENMSIDCDHLKCKETDSILYGSGKWSLVPNNCSTPAFNL